MRQYCQDFLGQTQRGGGGKRRGLGPRNDVLTTCKAVTPRGGQRKIAVLFPQQILLEFLEARSDRQKKSEMLTEKIKIEKNNIMHLCFSFISYLSLSC